MIFEKTYALRRGLIGAIALLAAGAAVGIESHAKQPEQQLSGPAEVLDGDSIIVDAAVVRLRGIDAPETGQQCQRDDGDEWDCGRAASDALRELLGDAIVTCRGSRRDRYNRLLAYCRLQGDDIAEHQVRRGNAVAYLRYDDTYRDAQRKAKDEKLGIWSGTFKSPAEFRSAAWLRAEKLGKKPDCPIKGNINRGGTRIYHMPWSRSYDKTRINVSRGERWFCNEAEAVANGWRRAKSY